MKTNANKPVLVKKEKSHAFGKDIYLLGRLNGERIWLERASWDCGWYWGFGYVESYTDDKTPSRSRDISMHTHYNCICLAPNPDNTGSYMYILQDNPHLTECTLTESEQWQLSDLMKSFYTLRAAAEIYRRGGSNMSSSGKLDALKREDLEKEINEKHLPAIFEAIYKLLTPEEHIS